MRISQMILPEFDHEMANTRKILERVPDGKGDYKPHGKSFPLAHLAQHVSRLPTWTGRVLDNTEFDVAPASGTVFPGYTNETTARLLTDFDKNVADARVAIARTTDEQFQVPWSFKRTGKAMFTMPRYAVLRSMMLNHLIHHRAQLQVYLRLNDVPVPGFYGPSADERAG
jgi:uncharacterized damage-inducible protein DinB